jgi:hypothetical protein
MPIMKKKPTEIAAVPIPLNFVELIDELGRIDSMFECAFMAVGGAAMDRKEVNAVQSVMLVAQDRLHEVMAKVEYSLPA